MTETNRCIRIGLVGCGNMGSKYMRHLWDMTGETLLPTVLIDNNVERLQALATKYPPALTFADHRSKSILQHVDAIIVAASTSAHFDIASYFLESGKDVLVEKPMCNAVVEAQQLVDLAQRNERVLQVGHIERFNPMLPRLANTINAPKYIEFLRTSSTQGRTMKINVVYDLMVHDIDILSRITSARPTQVVPITCDPEFMERAEAGLLLSNGIYVRLRACRGPDVRILRRVYACYSVNKCVFVDLDTRRECRIIGGKHVEKLNVSEARDALREEIIDFVECIRKRTPPQVTGGDGVAALQIADMIMNAFISTKTKGKRNGCTLFWKDFTKNKFIDLSRSCTDEQRGE